MDFPARISPTIEGDFTNCGRDQKPFQPVNVHPRVLDPFYTIPRLFNAGREITSQIANDISSRENNRHTDNSRV